MKGGWDLAQLYLVCRKDDSPGVVDLHLDIERTAALSMRTACHVLAREQCADSKQRSRGQLLTWKLYWK